MPILELDRPVILEVHDNRIKEFAARLDAEVLGERAPRAHALERDHLRPVPVSAASDLIGDSADLERMRPGLRRRDETADARDAYEDALVRELAQRAVRRHPRDPEGFHDLALRRNARRGAPGARFDVAQDVALHLYIEWLDGTWRSDCRSLGCSGRDGGGRS